jgi:CRP-like cAMP-binding protein
MRAFDDSMDRQTEERNRTSLFLVKTPRRTRVQLDPTAFQADPELVMALETRATPIACDEDNVLFRQGDPSIGVYILQKGEATISMNPGNEGVIFSCKATAGAILGLPGLIANQPYSLSAYANRGSQVGFVTRRDFETLMQSERPLLLFVLQVLAAEVRSARLAITQL